MRLHDYPASGNCYKVRLLLAQLGVDYERVHVDIFDGDTLTDEFAALNPARTTPVLETDAGESLLESNAILVYLAEGTELLPDDSGRARAGAALALLRAGRDRAGHRRPALAPGHRRAGAGQPAGARRSGRRRGRAAAARASTCASAPSWSASATRSPTSAVYAYVHVAGEAGLDLADYPAVQRLDRARGGDPAATSTTCEPIPPDTRFGAGRSIYG